jgi:hypothetical protein
VPASKNSFMDHVKWLRIGVQSAGGDLLLAGNTMQALLRMGGRHWALYPQFLAITDGRSSYEPVWTDNVTHFAGWLPYTPRRWPVAGDKLTFKRFAAARGLPLPAFSVDPGSDMADVVVKRASSSFGRDIRGPFRSASETTLDLTQSEYYERFVQGEILKIWYWDEHPVCMEVDTMAAVKGDGHSTWLQLVEERAHLVQRRGQALIERLRERSRMVMDYSQVDPAAVPARGDKQLVDFRYGSELMHPRGRRVVDLREPGDESHATLKDYGRALRSGIPEAPGQGVTFTVDAIRDTDGKIWLLEMNSNPTVHPLVYPQMVQALFAEVPSEAGHTSFAASSLAPTVAQTT